ncbi:MAG: 2-C-methyl-D-erythritol 4-phosphate cytidylyltransferase, partial [Nitrospinota bacterium]
MGRPAWALVAAAGEGERFGGTGGPGRPGTPARRRAGVPRKQFAELGGEPLLLRTLSSVAAAPSVGGVVVALPRGELARWRKRLKGAAGGKPLKAVAGGATRQESVARALG